MVDACHYGIERNEKYGRYLIANKDLGCGELIFTDVPVAVGPKPGKLLADSDYSTLNVKIRVPSSLI